MTEQKGQSLWATLPGLVTAETDGSITQLTNDARDDGYPTWSPDGSQVAWAAGPARRREIWVMDSRDGTAARRLTTGADDLHPSRSSSGPIAFERHVGASSEIWVDGIHRIFVVDADGQSNLESMTPSASCDCEEPTWSPDGTQIAYLGPGTSGGVVRPIMVIAVAGGEPRRVTTNGLGPFWGG